MSVITTSRRWKAGAGCRGSSPRVWGWLASAAFLVGVSPAGTSSDVIFGSTARRTTGPPSRAIAARIRPLSGPRSVIAAVMMCRR